LFASGEKKGEEGREEDGERIRREKEYGEKNERMKDRKREREREKDRKERVRKR
jgi:hypothetical protein